ncbi:Presequence protease, mitochondrial [Coccomyxa sp. Obi]|nr:Presequence protease, mitochondrial [Coccomyxa sp. Obi]
MLSSAPTQAARGVCGHFAHHAGVLRCSCRSTLRQVPSGHGIGRYFSVPAQLKIAASFGRSRSLTTLSHCLRAVAAPAEAEVEARPAPKELHGFELVREQFVNEYDSQVLMYRHKKTGAEVMSLINKDENKTFGAVFRTPVDNSKGIPHILEHSVLCGSKKYPIKEPFVELMKGSLNTFLNAFTYPDRTCYPVASTNLQDFYNLVDVYLDAVLYPNCVRDPKTFAQEGWHYELENPEDELTFKGVVFNEMKGVYSSPDSMNSRATQHALFPNNTYADDSGGDPAAIPDLTFEEFKGFHERYYHPSNGRFWFYGDDPPEERLRVLASFLDNFEKRPVDSTVKPQPLFQEPRKVVERYAAGDGAGDDDSAGKAFVSLNWLLSEEPLDLETELAWGFLDYLLLGTSAAPLRKALNDSGLGEALIGGGLGDELRQPVFSLGLKGVKPENAAKVEEVIMSNLERLAEEGFTDTAVEAAINTIEFSLRENNTGSFPRGLSLMLRAMSSWIYDQDPFQPLQWTKELEHFKGRLASGEDVFGPLLRKFLLENKHRVSVEMLPDTGLAAQKEAVERERLATVRAAMGPEDVEAVIKETKELKERQETPDPPEALSCMPSLQLSDIPTEASTIPTDVTSMNEATLLTHDLFTNNVVYIEAALNLRTVPAELLPLVPLFCRCLTQMGTEKESFIELTERIGRKTGGLSVSPFVSDKRGTDEPVAMVMISGKAMGDKAGDLLDLFTDVLLTARLDDRERFKQMVLETRASLEAGVIGAGHRFAASRLDAQRSTAGWVKEQMGGISYLAYIRKLAARVDSEWDVVKADLEAIRSKLLQSRGALVNMTADERTLQAVQPLIGSFLGALPAHSASDAVWTASLPRRNEGITVPTQVNYVGKAVNLYADAGYQLSGSAYVVNKHLGTTWLWDRVRVSGGAYGGFSDFDTHSGMFSFLSYRDPNLTKTVDVYDGTPEFLRTLELDNDSLTKAIIGTIGDIDAYQLPDAKGYTAFLRHVLGVSNEERQQRRDQILGTTLKDFREFADYLSIVSNPEHAKVVAVTSAERAEAALNERPGFFDEVTKIL